MENIMLLKETQLVQIALQDIIVKMELETLALLAHIPQALQALAQILAMAQIVQP